MTTLAFSPGIHAGIPAESYHAAPFLSNSALKNWRAMGPRKWQWHRDHPQPRESTEAQIRGTLFHLATFEPHLFGVGVSHFVKPPGMKFSNKEGIAWKAEHEHLPIVSTADNAGIIGAAEALRTDDFTGPMLRAKGTAEATVMALHEATGLELKMRADWLTEDATGRPWILDAKSIESLAGLGFAARDYAYDVQSVFYTDMLESLGIADTGFLFAAVELEPPFDVRLVTIDAGDIRAARELYESDLAVIANCRERGEWPRKYPGVGRLRIPRRFAAEGEEVFA